MFSRGPLRITWSSRSAAAIPYDEWDRWNSDRDRFFERAKRSHATPGPDIDGAQETGQLLAAGYGTRGGVKRLRVPNNEPPDWALYRDGRWEDVDYYGWSWVGYEP